MNLKVMDLDSINNILKKQKIFRLKKILLSSQIKSLKKAQNLSPSEKIMLLIKGVGASEDYCGETAVKAYMDEELFKKNGIKILAK